MTGVVKRAARAIVIDDDGRLLLVKRTKPGRAPYWTTPGGGVEPGDVSVKHAMVRELREELGAEVGAVQQVFLVSEQVGAGGVAVQHFFVCCLRRLDLDRRHGPEFLEPGRGRYDLDRVVLGADGTLPVDLKPAEVKAFIEANWNALIAAVASDTTVAAGVTGPGVQVVAALLWRGDHIVLVREQRDGQEIWSIPGGGVERGELLSEALIREVWEETGLRLAAVGPLAYVVNTTTERYPSAVVLAFDCVDWDGEIAPRDPDGEVTGAVLLPLAEAKQVLASSGAGRPEIEPLLAHLDDAAGRTRLWSYRDDHPIG